MTEKVRVLLEDDNRIYLMSLKDYFEQQANIEVYGVAENGQQVIEFLKQIGLIIASI